MGNFSLTSKDQLFIVSSVITEQDKWRQTQKAKPCSDSQAHPPISCGLKRPHNSPLGRLGEVWKGLPCPAHLGGLGQLQSAFEAGPTGQYRAPTRAYIDTNRILHKIVTNLFSFGLLS